MTSHVSTTVIMRFLQTLRWSNKHTSFILFFILDTCKHMENKIITVLILQHECYILCRNIARLVNYYLKFYNM